MWAQQQVLLSYWAVSWASNWLLTNLVSYYELEANSNDSHWSNNCTEANTTYVTWKIANACSFNGSTSSMRTSAISLVAGNSPYTINFWVKLNAEITTGNWWIMNLNPDATLQDTFYAVTYNYNWWTRRLNYEHYYNWPETYYSLTYNVTLGTANWNMVTLVYSWTWMNMYFNWTSVASWWWTGVYWFNATPTYQKWLTIWSLYFLSWFASRSNTIIDEVGFRNTNLSSTKITDLYNAWSWLAYASFTS